MVNRHRDPGMLPLSHARDMAPAEQDAERTAKELRELREFLQKHFDDPWAKLEHIRTHQRIHLRAKEKYPDVIEVGIDVWDALHDWHVRFRHPIQMTRNAEGRYEILFIDSRIILRLDFRPTEVALGYDDGDPRSPSPK